MDPNLKNLSEEEYLKRHLMDLESSKHQTEEPSLKVQVENTTVDNLKYFAFDVREFPCGIFYPAGATIQIRPADVREIQAYSMIDDTNYYDMVEKMNDMLASCVRIKYQDGSIGTYMDLKDPDRFYLIFTIRELTFQQGNSLVTKTNCTCGLEVQLELKRENFRNFKVSDKLNPFYNPAKRCFTFETVNGEIHHLSPPTIGLQKAFTDYIVKENTEGRKPNLSFLKIIPFTLYDRTTITLEGIKSKLEEFVKLSNNSFQFLNSAVGQLTFGIEKVSKLCSCGMEVHSDKIFPDGPSAVFVVHDAFDRYIKK